MIASRAAFDLHISVAAFPEAAASLFAKGGCPLIRT
jgi:hypothetical protein